MPAKFRETQNSNGWLRSVCGFFWSRVSAYYIPFFVWSIDPLLLCPSKLQQNKTGTGPESNPGPGYACETRDDSPGATIFSDHTFSTTFRGSIVVSIPACHAGDPGSIPGLGAFFDIPVFQFAPGTHRGPTYIQLASVVQQ